jgi:hypothetical protein
VGTVFPFFDNVNHTPFEVAALRTSQLAQAAASETVRIGSSAGMWPKALWIK